MRYTQLELAKIFGQPLDPRKRYTDLIEAVCETDTASPSDYYYYFDALLETDKVIISNTASGIITQENITPDTPALITFVDLASPEYYIKLTDLANAKEKTIARKLKTINRALNAEENYQVIQLLNTATTATGNTFGLRSGYNRFIFLDLVDMIESVADYGSAYSLISASQIDKDIKTWIFDDNKYRSLIDAMKDLGVDSQVRIGTPHKVTRDGASTQVLSTDTAFLVAKDAEAGKPGLFVRKRLSEIEMLGGLINDVPSPDERPERIVFGSQNPVQVGSTRYLAIGICGYEQYAVAVTNRYAVAEYNRS